MRSVLAIVIIESILTIETGNGEERIHSMPSKHDQSEQTFRSQTSKNGSIKSPDYPYSSHTERYRKYVFSGEANELVRVVFDYFNLYKKNSNVECSNEDSRLVYKRKDGSQVILCGNNVPLPILSDNNYFVLEFWQAERSSNANEELQGFNATYKFVTNFGVEGGEQEGGCQFVYNSDTRKKGTFYSPNYPGYYLKSMECFYHFEGAEPYLRFDFSNFSLLGSDSCSSDDFVELKGSADGDKKYYYDKLCGTLNPFTIEVNSSYFFIVFHSSDKYIGEGQQTQRSFVGFNATYTFANDTINAASALFVRGSATALIFGLFCVSTGSLF